MLVELREYQNEKADIVHKFRPDEVKNLIKSKQVPASCKYTQLISAMY